MFHFAPLSLFFSLYPLTFHQGIQRQRAGGSGGGPWALLVKEELLGRLPYSREELAAALAWVRV